MSLNCARRDAEHRRTSIGIKVKEQAKGDNLPLPGRQAHQGRHDPRIDGTVGLVDCRQVRHRAGVWHRYLPAATAPPGDVRIQRGAHHPCPWRRMPADRAPGRPGPGEGLGHKILRRVVVTDAHQHGQEAFVLGPSVELRKVQSLSSHTPSTHSWHAPVTWLVPARAPDGALNTGKTPTLNPGSLASRDTSATAKGWPLGRCQGARGCWPGSGSANAIANGTPRNLGDTARARRRPLS